MEKRDTVALRAVLFAAKRGGRVGLTLISSSSDVLPENSGRIERRRESLDRSRGVCSSTLKDVTCTITLFYNHSFNIPTLYLQRDYCECVQLLCKYSDNI